MGVVKKVLPWLFVLVCFGALLTEGLFSLSGLLGLVLGVLALPVGPVRQLWASLLPPEAPRFAKGGILLAAFLVMLAAAGGTAGQGTTAADTTAAVVAEETAAPTAAPVVTATPSPTPSPTPTAAPEPTATPEPAQTPTPAPTAVSTQVPAAATEQPDVEGDKQGQASVSEQPAATPIPQVQTQSGTVYIASSGNGSKYHSNPSCSRMKDATPLTRSEAEARGYTPCKKCYG